MNRRTFFIMTKAPRGPRSETVEKWIVSADTARAASALAVAKAHEGAYVADIREVGAGGAEAVRVSMG